MERKLFCFVFMGNLYLCPYITKYIENMDCDFDIIYWNRDNIDEDITARNIYRFDYDLKPEDSKWRKFKGYFAFKQYAQKVLKKNDYTGVILLQTIAGIILHNAIRKSYFRKYILDIRDYTLEQNRLFYHIENKVIKDSAMTVISSDGFKNFLPKHEFITVHNNRPLDDSIVASIKNRKKHKDKLVIAFIGFISYLEQQKKLIMKLKNNEKFELRFIGKGADKLITFCRENDIRNVKLIDKFLPENIMEYYKDVDFINNLYGNNTPVLDYALSNKLYFAAQLYIPILVCPDTHMAQVSNKYGFGYIFDFDDINQVDNLLKFYNNIDWIRFQQRCDTFYEKVLKDNNYFKIKINKFFEKETYYD